ncbi:MAG: CheB methylesterase domain-containing protein [Roseovarius sp.]
MTATQKSSLSVLLLDPRKLRSGRFLLSIAGTPEISLVGATKDLTQAYDLTEHEHPDLVVIAEEVVRLSNFPMYFDMLKLLEVECLVIGDERVAERPASVPGERLCARRIEAEGGLGAYLKSRFRLGPRPAPARPPASVAPAARGGGAGWKTLVIGASTGGVEALIEVLSAFPEVCPPTLIVQHISGNFLPGLAQRLDRHCRAQVRPAGRVDELRPGLVLMAPGNEAHLIIGPGGRRARLVEEAPVSGHRPSVDMLFHSAAALGPGAVGALLTGMGRDGAQGLLAMRQAGAFTLAQDAASSAVYGMPRAAQELGAVCQQVPISQMAQAILKAASHHRERSRHA